MITSSYKNQVVVITGASSGIGRELAFQLSKRGARLSLAARDTARLESVVKECERYGGRAIALPTDVTNQAQCSSLIQRTVHQYNRIDILINNAGLTMSALFDKISNVDIFEQLIRVNYLGSVYCTFYALPFLKQSRGRIVGISSLTGKNGVPTRTGYAASKHAMAGFFDSLRIELTDSGVAVTMVYPGFVATEMREHALDIHGTPIGKSHLNERDVMPVKACVEMILSGVEKRKREIVMTLRGKVGLWLKLIAPTLVDRIAQKAILNGRT